MIDKREINLREKKNRTYLIYTLLFVIISFIVFIVFIKYNKSFVWQGDGIKQHFAILYDFNQIVRNIFKDGIPMLSWNLGLGLDVIGQYSYYVIGDPFAYISLLFPMEYLEVAYNFLVIFRIYCVGLAFIAYCKYTKKENINIILGSIIYTFSGFILYAGVRHPYFTNATIFLPLTLLGIEKLLKENKKIFFIFIIFLSAISNYYFFYMITIVTIIYGVIKYIVEYNEGIKMFFEKVGSACLCYIMGVLMASIVILPTVYTFLNSARTECEKVTTYIDGFYKFFFMGIISMRFKNWAVIAVSSIVILMISILISKIKKDKEAKSFFILFVVATIMLLIPQVASMMNGFSFPSNRWVFSYTFILAYITTICFNVKLDYSKKQKMYMLIALLLYTSLGICITKFNIKENIDYYIIGLLTYIMYFVILYKYKINTNLASYLILLLIIVNISVISASLYFPKGKGYVKEFIKNGTVQENCRTVNGKIENFKEAIEYIKENDKEFYRISKKEVSYQNLSVMYEYNPIQLYLSLGNQSVFNLSCELEDNSYSSTQCVNGGDRRTKYTTLLANKYYICDKKHFRYVPYGYTLYHEIGNTHIYINENYLPVGILYDSYIHEEQFNKLSPLEKEDALITTATIKENQEINVANNQTNIQIDRPLSLKYNVKDNRIKNNSINITKNNETIEVDILNIYENSEIYLSINNIKNISNDKRTDFKITAKIDGISNSENVKDKNSSAYYMDNKNFLINLGIIKNIQNNKLKITFNKKGTYAFDSFEILAVDMQKYEQKVEKLKNNVLENVEYGKDYLKGTVNLNKSGILQITTSYSDGWKAYVDEKEVEVFKVNQAFIGINIEEGKHQVRFEYETPFLKMGSICSALGILAYISIILIEKKKIASLK